MPKSHKASTSDSEAFNRFVLEEIDKLKTNGARLESEVDILKLKNSVLEQQNEKHRGEINTLHTKNAALEEANEKHRGQVANLYVKMEVLEKEKNELNDEKIELKKSLEKATAEGETHLQGKTEVSARLVEETGKNMELEREIGELKVNVEQLEKEKQKKKGPGTKKKVVIGVVLVGGPGLVLGPVAAAVAGVAYMPYLLS